MASDSIRWQLRTGRFCLRKSAVWFLDQSDGVIGSQLSLAVRSDADRVDEVSGSDAVDAFESQEQDFKGDAAGDGEPVYLF